VIGPNTEGQFKPVQVKTIQFKRVEVDSVQCGNSCSLKLKSLDKTLELKHETFRKGMILLSQDNDIYSCMEFDIEALIVHHSSTIKIGYQSVVHCHVVRQTATIIWMNKEFMRAGDDGIIRFRFLQAPEYLHVGDIVLFREGRTRGKGKITKIYPYDEKKEKLLEKKEKVPDIKKEKVTDLKKEQAAELRKEKYLEKKDKESKK
jgi:GTPase